MESAVGNEKALASSVTCTAEAPVALPVYNNFSFSVLCIFPPDSINPFVCIFLSLQFISLLRLFASHLARRLPPFLSIPLFLSLSQSLRSVYGKMKSSLYK